MSRTTMEKIRFEWNEYTPKNLSDMRWVGVKGFNKPPARQLELKDAYDAGDATTFKIAYEEENRRWVLYKFKGKEVKARELVVSAIAIWAVFRVWIQDKKSDPTKVARTFFDRYTDLDFTDVIWFVEQFQLLRASEMSKEEKRWQGRPGYKDCKDFSLVKHSVTPSFLIHIKKGPKPAKTIEGVEKAKATVPTPPAAAGKSQQSKDLTASDDIGLGTTNSELKVLKASKDIGTKVAKASEDFELGVFKAPDDIHLKVGKDFEDIRAKVAEASKDIELNATKAFDDAKSKVAKASRNITSTAEPNLGAAHQGFLKTLDKKNKIEGLSTGNTADGKIVDPEHKTVKTAKTRYKFIVKQLGSEDEDSEVDVYGFSLQEDTTEDEEKEKTYADTPPPAKAAAQPKAGEAPPPPARKEPFPLLSIPRGAKQGRVKEKDWPTDFNAVIDRVGCYTVKNQNGKSKEMFWFLKSGYDWIQYDPVTAGEPEVKRRRKGKGMGLKFHPNTTQSEILRKTGVTAYINKHFDHSE